jgi:hypothetical protein
MRTVELKDQSDIIRSIKVQGGHARKWASGWQMGMPDIVGSFPTVCPFLMEVKQISTPVYDNTYKLEVTDKQRLELNSFSSAGFLCCIGVVLHRSKRTKTLCIEDWWATHLGQGRGIGGPIMVDWDPTTKTYNVKSVMDRYRRTRV